MKSEYLLFNIFIIGSVLLSTLLFRRFTKYVQLIPAFIAIGMSAFVFIIVDQIVTNTWWYFNPLYILGVYIGSLPIEEMLFFLTVPFACLHLWVNLKRIKIRSLSIIATYSLVLLLWLIVLVLLVIYHELVYTRYVLLALASLPIIDLFLKTRLLSSPVFILFISGGVNIMTLLFNGYLTARPIAMYNPSMKSNIQIASIPIEDFVYGMCLIFLVICVYEYIVKSKTNSIQNT